MKQLGMPVSDDTILRHLKRNASQADDEPPAGIIGIDDWSWRKLWRYGTIIVDLERKKVMDILEDRRWRNQLRRTQRQFRKEVFETVHALSKEGLSCSEIARCTAFLQGRSCLRSYHTMIVR